MSLAEKMDYTEMPDDVTPEMLAKIDQICAENRGKPGSLIPVLQACQGVVGYLPEVVQQRIASGLGVSGHEVFGVATFYSFFTMKPRGRNVVRVCLGTACYVRGGKETMDRLTQHLHLNADGTTADRRFTVEGVRCLGACGVAPVMVVNEDTHRKVMADSVIKLVESYQ